MDEQKLVRLTWGDVYEAAEALAGRHRADPPWGYYGVPGSGSHAVQAIIAIRNFFTCNTTLSQPGSRPLNNPCKPGDCVIVDAVVDSGKSIQRWLNVGHTFDALFRKPDTPEHIAPKAVVVDGWIVFPWEECEGRTVVVDNLTTKDIVDGVPRSQMEAAPPMLVGLVVEKHIKLVIIRWDAKALRIGVELIACDV